jgi:hypothetical protein
MLVYVDGLQPRVTRYNSTSKKLIAQSKCLKVNEQRNNQTQEINFILWYQ